MLFQMLERSPGSVNTGGSGLMPKYKCTECGYVTSDQQQLVSHALEHQKSRGLPIIKPASNASAVNRGNSQVEGAYYVCSICSYICDTQRCLKAHMWKHLGHKNLEYPTFKNGPLSVYDGTPLAANNFVGSPSNASQSPSKILFSSATNSSRNNIEINNGNSTTAEPLTPRSASREPSPKRVIVEKINQVSDTNPGFSNVGSHFGMDTSENTRSVNTSPKDSMATDEANSTKAVDSSKDLDACNNILAGEMDSNELQVPSQNTSEVSRIDPNCYSANEKTAATLLSLLRQGNVHLRLDKFSKISCYKYEVIDDNSNII